MYFQNREFPYFSREIGGFSRLDLPYSPVQLIPLSGVTLSHCPGMLTLSSGTSLPHSPVGLPYRPLQLRHSCSASLTPFSGTEGREYAAEPDAADCFWDELLPHSPVLGGR